MKRIKNKTWRSILTEFTPFEHPLSLDMRNLYYFLESVDFELINDHEFIVSRNKLKQKNNKFILETIFEHSQLTENAPYNKNSKKYSHYSFNKNSGISPYSYQIQSGLNKFRAISMMHPSSMIQASKFLHDNRYTILYFCSRSNFSIRKPVKIASRYSVPKLLDKKLENTKYGIAKRNVEVTADLTKNFRSYFIYDKFNLIYKFYDSEEIEESELLFTYFNKLDVAKCFPSIYTHSISWATNGWQTSKRKFTDSSRKEDLRDTFGNRFDGIMQCINHRETNGIIIGPEISRIFAEIIFQKIDKNIEGTLLSKHLVHRKDYVIYRYVDDYFIYTNSRFHSQLITDIISKNLSIYKLYLNEDKQKLIELPDDNTYSYIKRGIRDNITNFIKIDIEKNLVVKFSSKNFNNRYKELLQSSVDSDSYSTIGYTYSLLIKKLDEALIAIDTYSADNSINYQSSTIITNFFNDILHTAFFLFRTNPNYSNSVKLISIIYQLVKWESENESYSKLMWSHIKDKIYAGLEQCLTISSAVNSLPLHILNILEVLLYMKFNFTEELIYRILVKYQIETNDLSCNEILIFYKISITNNLQKLKISLDNRIGFILDNSKDPEFMTQASIIKLAFGFDPRNQGMKNLGSGRTKSIHSSVEIFDWEPQKYFGLSLAYKQNSVVY